MAFDSHTAYPGSLVAIPVVGAALVIAGGASRPPAAAESLLRLAPFRWLGMRSYSLYLWHWPILILAADAAGSSSLPFRKNALWLLVALAASAVTFSLVENPVRHARLHRLGRWTPVLLGFVLIIASVGVATAELDSHGSSTPAAPPVTGGGAASPPRPRPSSARTWPPTRTSWSNRYGRRRTSGRYLLISRLRWPECQDGLRWARRRVLAIAGTDQHPPVRLR